MKKYALPIVLAATLVTGVFLGTGFSESYTYEGITYEFGVEDFTTVAGIDYQYGRANDGDFDSSDDNQGGYLGTAYGTNDSETALMAFLEWSLDWQEVTFSGKYGDEEEGNLYWPHTQEFESETISGTWQTYENTVPDDPEVVDFIIVKGGSNFSVHEYDPAASYGEWNVGYLPNAGESGHPPEVSHLSAYKGAAPVPEPASILLLSTGLLGLAVYGSRGRKRHNPK